MINEEFPIYVREISDVNSVTNYVFIELSLATLDSVTALCMASQASPLIPFLQFLTMKLIKALLEHRTGNKLKFTVEKV